MLRPAFAAFARPITVRPVVSQPGAAPYAARGIWSSKPVDVQMADGSILSSRAARYARGIPGVDAYTGPRNEAASGDRMMGRAFKSGVVGGGAQKIEGSASVDITLNGFPAGTRTRTSAEGLFRDINLNRGRQMQQAEDFPLALP